MHIIDELMTAIDTKIFTFVFVCTLCTIYFVCTFFAFEMNTEHSLLNNVVRSLVAQRL